RDWSSDVCSSDLSNRASINEATIVSRLSHGPESRLDGGRLPCGAKRGGVRWTDWLARFDLLQRSLGPARESDRVARGREDPVDPFRFLSRCVSTASVQILVVTVQLRKVASQHRQEGGADRSLQMERAPESMACPRGAGGT